jgi:hypothetical protein
MRKNVKFSETVKIRYMDMSLKDHAMEVKNPTGVAIVNDTGILDNPSVTTVMVTSSINSMWWAFGFIVFILIWWLLWKFYRKEPTVQESEK